MSAELKAWKSGSSRIQKQKHLAASMLAWSAVSPIFITNAYLDIQIWSDYLPLYVKHVLAPQNEFGIQKNTW